MLPQTYHLDLLPSLEHISEDESGVGQRCMGVIWFVFHVLQLLPIRFYTTKHVVHQKFYNGILCKNRIENWTFPYLMMVFGKCMFVGLLTGYKGPLNLFNIECRVGVNS
jgi:hypothetical protein